MKPVRYGIIGAGVIANHMARAFTEGRGSVATVVADLNQEAASKLAEKAGNPKITADYKAVLADPEVDAVYLATPPFLHRPMTVEALRAGKHVCCEKPFMLTRAEVGEVIAAQKASAGLHVNCASSRYNCAGTARKAKQMIAAGELGKLYHVSYTQVNGSAKPGAKMPDWRNDPAKNGGGISFDWGPYDLDWLSFVLGDLFRPQLVFSTLGNYFRSPPSACRPASMSTAAIPPRSSARAVSPSSGNAAPPSTARRATPLSCAAPRAGSTLTSCRWRKNPACSTTPMSAPRN